MYDIISVVFVVGFFALCVAYTHACDRILGPDEQAAAETDAGDPSGPGRRGGGGVTPVLAASGADNWTAMVLAVGLVVFLFFALIFPGEAVNARSRVDPVRRAGGAAHRQHADRRRLHGEGVRQRHARRATASSDRSSG